MTRPRVPPDQRQRTAQACESCKRRKQKCNGLCPCNTCEKRKFACVYSDREHVPSPSDATSSKRKIDDVEMGDDRSGGGTSNNELESSTVSHHSPGLASVAGSSRTNGHMATSSQDITIGTPSGHAARPSAMQQYAQQLEDEAAPRMSRGSTHSGDEEAEMYSQTRLLQDPTGRLLYIGDSGSLSYLQLVRTMVEDVSGPSPFTTDPRRLKIVESALTLSPQFRPTHLLPDKTTANILADAFFVNTQGLIHIFDREKFFRDLNICYDNPLRVNPEYLCIKNLVFAIGLMLATPRQGSPEASIIDSIRSEQYDRSEEFYQNAKNLSDPLHGFEDADFWSVQALLLMSVYMLSKSKRNASFALLGMAVRSGYALGLHREETIRFFSPEEQTSRRNLWKSLFVMDRFLSCSLGRPVAIHEDECSGDTLKPPEFSADGKGFQYESGFAATFNQIASLGLEAAVRSCSNIGTVLKRVYQHRKISTRLAQEIADVCKLWSKALAPILHWRQAAAASPSQGMAILHVNLFYCHSIVLLTRPFFLYILRDKLQRILAGDGDPDAAPGAHVRMGKFAEACIVASTHTVKLVQQAYDAGYLARRNPVVIYFLFSASLILLSNEYAMLYPNTTDPYIRQSITIMSYSAGTDPQASRLLYILTTFRDAVAQQHERRAHPQQQGNGFFQDNNVSHTFGNSPHEMHTMASAPEASSSNMYAGYHNGIMSNAGYNNIPFSGATMSSSVANSPTHAFHHQRDNSASTLPSIANLTAPTPATATSAPAPHPPSTAHPSVKSEFSFASLLDLSALDGPSRSFLQHEDVTLPDEQIDFDALWAWSTPAMGTPRFESVSGPGGLGPTSAGMNGPMGDPTVPLYHVIDN